MNGQKWKPLDKCKLEEIKDLFRWTYPSDVYGDLAPRIGEFWMGLLRKTWEEKSAILKEKDLAYDPADPLSRLQQRITIITYADSIRRRGKASLAALDNFLKTWFPAVGGLHILPACIVVEDRFNDGYFSQVERNTIHAAFGTNELFADLMHRYFSMNDLVMGHVDIENPLFRKYLAGDDRAGKTFFVFPEGEYQRLKKAGRFDKVFRPRPFPLFTVFRRLPAAEPYRSFSHGERREALEGEAKRRTGMAPDPPVTNILWLFRKILNDQMLLEGDFRHIPVFIDWLKGRGIPPESIFTRSRTQEVRHIPYIFKEEIDSRETLLRLSEFSPNQAAELAGVFDERHEAIFGEEIRALTTFSHVQVDVSTTTFEGLQRLGEDLAWYLSMDLKMLRLDAVNYAFKKWGTSCFGLPELDRLMKIVYLSMECVSPRIVPNLEVNDSLTTILTRMSAKTAPPPMMHDFSLVSLLPTVFHLEKPAILNRIFAKIAKYNRPAGGIRFSLSESHDGKSVRGSMDLLEFGERRILTEAVLAKGGYVKYKSIPPRRCPAPELEQFCGELGLASGEVREKLLNGNEDLVFKESIQTLGDVFAAVSPLGREDRRAVAAFFFTRLLEGRDPYELCISTRDSLPPLDDPRREADRYLAFHTLAFALMGRNVKTIYFNDLLGLPNDSRRVEKSGELRDIKRTKTDYDELLPLLKGADGFTASVARGINNLIALADSDPALFYRGQEAEMISPIGDLPLAVVHNRWKDHHSLIIVNLSGEKVGASIPLGRTGWGGLEGVYDNLADTEWPLTGGDWAGEIEPFGRLWLSRRRIDVPPEKLRD